MLILPRSCFLHVPKTGGSWVKQAILAAGIPAREHSRNGDTHLGLADCPDDCSFRFAFVRNPLGLYRSYWQFKQTVGWDPENELDRKCRADDFTRFVTKVLLAFPGVYARSLRDYVGPPETPIEFIGRFENLVEDLVRALTLAGETFAADAIRGLPPSNVSDKQKAPAQFTPELEAAVRAAEAEVFERFGYT
ncbi:MAG: hypothetical protein ACO3PV_04395 [Pseudohongiellaceae bacterium]